MRKIGEGIYGIYKPKGPTSHDIVAKIRKITGIRKVGHAGTLDPLAEGILVIAVGREATKKLGVELEKEKEYLAKVKLGTNSVTDDEEGEKNVVNVEKKPNLKEIENVLESFIGEIKQISPRYSAVKVAGQEAYKRARRGEIFTPPPRIVEIKEIEILQYCWPFLELRVVTGPGVYIRSLAREIGEKLKTGGYLANLARTRVGDFTAENSIFFSELENLS